MIRYALMGLAAAGLLNAQQLTTTSAVGKTTATVVYPLTIEKLADLDFGAAISPSTASQVEISPDKWSSTGTRHLITGNAQFLDDKFNQAAFMVKGTPGEVFQVSVIPDTILHSGRHTMTVKWYQISSQYVFPSPDPSVKLTLGATLFIGAYQPKGEYSGDFNFTVNYK